MSNNLADLAKKCDTAALHLSDFDREKRRQASENAELLREVQELSANASLMLKTKASLVAALDEAKVIFCRSSGIIFCLKYKVCHCLNIIALIITCAKANADHEAKDRVALLGKFRNLEHSAGGYDNLSNQSNYPLLFRWSQGEP